MGNTLNVNAQLSWSKMSYVLAAVVLAGILSGCKSGGGSGDSGGTVVNDVAIPLDNTLLLNCADVCIANETCILDDPGNPYKRSAIDDDTKFVLAAASPSKKSDYYLWCTAQARSPRGENQYFGALALHQMFCAGGSENAREQAKKAYKSVLDNYFGSVTFFSFDTADGPLNIPQLIRELVGDNMVTPQAPNLCQLFESKPRALEALGEWGYFYDEDTGLISKNS